jgi:hypothetical protein
VDDVLYIMTFGTFSGLSAQFGLLMINLYGSGQRRDRPGSGATAKVLVAGYAVPEAVKYVFLGPLVGAVARFAFSPLTDRWGRDLDARLRRRPHRIDPLHDPCADPGHLVGCRASGWLQPVPLGHARDLPLRRHR